MNIKHLSKWLAAANKKQRGALANRAKTSAAYLYQLATGRRTITAEVAANIEQGSKILHRNSDGFIPALDRRKLCDTCRYCPHAKKK